MIPVSGKNLSLETDLRSLITLATIVFSMLKVTRRLKILLRNRPQITGDLTQLWPSSVILYNRAHW